VDNEGGGKEVVLITYNISLSVLSSAAALGAECRAGLKLEQLGRPTLCCCERMFPRTAVP